MKFKWLKRPPPNSIQKVTQDKKVLGLLKEEACNSFQIIWEETEAQYPSSPTMAGIAGIAHTCSFMTGEAPGSQPHSQSSRKHREQGSHEILTRREAELTLPVSLALLNHFCRYCEFPQGGINGWHFFPFPRTTPPPTPTSS